MRHIPRAAITAVFLTGLVLMFSTTAYAAPPAAPSGLQVGGLPGARMRVAWTDHAGNETYLQLERSTGNRNGYRLLTTLPANKTEYVDTTVLWISPTGIG